jgi:hypothetical protein
VESGIFPRANNVNCKIILRTISNLRGMKEFVEILDIYNEERLSLGRLCIYEYLDIKITVVRQEVNTEF